MTRGPVGGRAESWWRRETERLGADQRVPARALRWLAARPGAVLVPVAAIAPGFLGAVIPFGDASLFRRSGLAMLGPGALDVFSAAALQIGPVYLLAVGLLARFLEIVGLPVLFTVAAVQSALLAAYVLHLTRRWAQELGADVLTAQWGVGVPVVLLGPLFVSISNGHPEEMLIGLVLAHVALLVRRGRPGRAGLLLGLATGVKLWAVLGAPLVLLRPRWRTVLVVGLVGAAVTAACYLPFLLFGEVRTFDFSWGAPLPFGIPLATGIEGSWGWRVVQALVVLVVGAVVARLRPAVGLSTVLAVVAARVVLDPLLQMYYPLPFLVVALIWLWTSPAAPGVAGRVVGSCAVLPVLTVPWELLEPARVATTHLVLVAATVAVVAAEGSRRRRRPVVSGAGGDLVHGGGAARVDDA